ncbi:DUF6221 family protein [Actinokineospora enzanensis]|uniref:DUF6221 family protein n=1 Tax=Actinokineospora enzanensis TaxID=155975 RepID=UPI00036B0F1E|nr:DUF6221 family protein [Actinokineospora enzanensis]
MAVADELRTFLRARLDEDEYRASRGREPWLDQAERLGRLRVLRSDDGRGLVLADSPVVPLDGTGLVPFAEKAPMLRAEIEVADEPTLRLLATAYDAHHAWLEEWRART